MYRPKSDARKMVLPIYGLYEDYENTVVIELSTGETATVKIVTEKASGPVKEADFHRDNAGVYGRQCHDGKPDLAGSIRRLTTMRGRALVQHAEPGIRFKACPQRPSVRGN